MPFGWDWLFNLDQIGSPNLVWEFIAKIPLGIKDLGLEQDKEYVIGHFVTLTSNTIN